LAGTAKQILNDELVGDATSSIAILLKADGLEVPESYKVALDSVS
jgi:hypothetical protein